MRQFACKLGPWALILGMGCESAGSEDSFSFIPLGHSECPAGGVAFTTGGETRRLCTAEAPGGDGSNGSNGSNGSDGQTGTTGENGAQGSTGSEGQVGPMGPMGAQGPAGPAGSAGADADSALTSGTRIELRRTSYTGDDGTYYANPWTSYYDTGLGVACNIGRTSDGSTRCIPSADGYVSGYHADAACAVPIVVLTGACATTPAFFVEGVAATGCALPGYTRTYRAGNPYAGDAYIKSGDNCILVTLSDGYRAFSLGAQLMPSQLVVFTEATGAL